MSNKTEETGVVPTSPKHMGDRLEIAGVHDRMLRMIPGSADLPKEVVLATAQIAVMYRLDPFNGEIAIAKMGSKKGANNQWYDVYVPLITLKGHRALARRQSNYVTNPRALEAEEVKALRRDLYDEGDIGVEVTLYRLDVAQQCKAVGVPYFPVKGLGFYRIKARAKKDQAGNIIEWKPDEIPETWTPFQVAEKRAEQTALRKAFDLRFPDHVLNDDYDVEVEAQSLMDAEDRATAIISRPERVKVGEDGEVYAI